MLMCESPVECNGVWCYCGGVLSLETSRAISTLKGKYNFM